MNPFPNELPPRPPQSIKQRHHCTNPRTCMTFTLSAYNIFTKNKTLFARRFCTLLVLLTRTTLSGFDVWGYYNDTAGIVLAVFSDLAIVWPLAVVCEASGERRLLGLRIVSFPVCRPHTQTLRTIHIVKFSRRKETSTKADRMLLQTRLYFDIFLGSMLIIHAVLLVCMFFVYGVLNYRLTPALWVLWGLAIVVALFATWCPERPSSAV